MLQKFEIRSVHTTLDDNLKKYVTKKIGHLDKYLSRHNNQSARAEVLLKEAKASDKRQCICEVVLHLPKETITVQESTLNMYASVDIVETKLKQKIQKYKGQHQSGKMHRHLFGRMRQQSDLV